MDGAMGTYFERLYGSEEIPEKAVKKHPEWIKEIHKEYLLYGADIVRSNTFALASVCKNREELKQSIEENVNALFWAIDEYRKEFGGKTIYPAASIGPVRVSTEEEEEAAYQTYCFMVDEFIRLGFSLFVLETFSDIGMAKRVAAYIKAQGKENTVFLHFVFNKMGYTRYGYGMQRLVDEIQKEESVDVIGFNCGIGAAHMNEFLEKVVFQKDTFLSVLPNAGYQQELGSRDMYVNNQHYFAKYVRQLVEKGANIIGGCCGTTPEHIAELRKILDENNHPYSKKIGVDEKEKISRTGTAFEQKLARGEKVFVVELDSPYTGSADKFVEGAFRLKENGVDLVTISDSPMAKPRADAFQMAVYVKNKTGLDMMPHIACRDRNLIGLHSAFLGAYINDIRNLLIITGDPVAREDREMITPVFDFNSIKLMEYVKNMNREVFGGDGFCYGGALNYATGKLENIAIRMQKKMESGCSFFLTQPMYSDEDMERVRKLKEMTGAKIFGGIMPLVSLKNARFIQNEMPGIHVPDEIVESYHEGQTREEAEKTAIRVSVEIGKKMADFVDGYYIMTPFHRVTLVNKIIEKLRG